MEERQPAPAPVVASAVASNPPPATAPSKKNVKSLLKGVIKKKDAKTKEATESVPTPTATKAPVHDAPPVTASAPTAPESNSKKRPAPALGALGGYDSDSDASDASDAEPDPKRPKV